MPERIDPGTAEWRTFGFEHLQRYHFAARFCQGRRVLDAGCGSGYGSEILALNGATSVVGVDQDSTSVDAARSHFSANGKVRFDVGEIEQIGEARFDAVVALELWEHLPQPALLIDAARHCLGKGGLLIVSTPNALQFSRHPTRPIRNEFHPSEMDYAQATALLRDGFRIVSEWEQSPSATEYLAGQVALWQASWAYRLENLLRRMLGRPVLEKAALFEGAYEPRVILPLTPDRRASCMQFIFVAERTE
jgi:SAM-dependent methyltransferase